MKVLVTGATGFVGRRLVARLAADGIEIVAVYRKQPAAIAAPGVTWRPVADIGPQTDWAAALQDVTAVVHLAALAHQLGHHGEGRMQEFRRINVEGTAALARACAASSSLQQFVFLSSIGAVAASSDTVLTDTTVCAPSTDYGRSKREAELALAQALGPTALRWCVLRPPLVYGPENPGNMARLAQLLRRNWPLPFGGIRNCRSLIYVDNLVDAIGTCLRRPPPAGETYFVTDGTDLSTAQLCALMARHMGIEARIRYAPAWSLRAAGRLGDLVAVVGSAPMGIDSYSVDRLLGSLWADGTRFRRDCGWEPPFTPEQGIAASCAAMAVRAGRESR
jgi:nucleoside-diphosphate-sugar epimerase